MKPDQKKLRMEPPLPSPCTTQGCAAADTSLPPLPTYKMSFPALPLPSPPSLPKAQADARSHSACRQGPRAPLGTTGGCRAGGGRGSLTPGAALKYREGMEEENTSKKSD